MGRFDPFLKLAAGKTVPLNRLDEIAKLIRGPSLVDVGSDHGQLLARLLKAGSIDFGIAIENHRLPFENSVRTLAGLNADVRFGDGLEPLRAGEAACLSICGMGAKNIRRILAAHPDRIPARIVVQPNNHPAAVRRWAWDNHFNLLTELPARKDWSFNIMSFGKSTNPKRPDPAYQGINLEAGLMFGPQLIRAGGPEFIERLMEEREYWSQFERLNESNATRLRLIIQTLDLFPSNAVATRPIVTTQATAAVQRPSSAQVEVQPPANDPPSQGHAIEAPTLSRSSDTRFTFFPKLNELADKGWLNSHVKFSESIAATHFNSNSLQDTFLRALGAQRVLPIKEVFESFEVFERVRKTARSPFVADLCCGHGLLGVLFAMFERKVDRVLLIDKQQPDSRRKLIDIAGAVAPWVTEKIESCDARIAIGGDWIEPGVSIVSAHACGVLSDLCIDIAIESGGPLAILPCCYPKSACQAPLALQSAFGLAAAFDIDRTYRLESAGYHVRWSKIPAQITPMNRILIARKTKQ